MKIYIDSTSAEPLAKYEQLSLRSKHIDMKAHHIKEPLRFGVVRLSHVKSALNVPDLLIKILDSPSFSVLISLLGLSREN